MQPTLITNLLKDLEKCREEEPAKFLSYEESYCRLKTETKKQNFNWRPLFQIFRYCFAREYKEIRCPMEAVECRKIFEKDLALLLEHYEPGCGADVKCYFDEITTLEDFDKGAS
jgi:hypothetical protein